MELKGEYRISASRQRVWEALNDPEILKKSIPGCSALEVVGDNSFAATVTAKVGPVKANFQGQVTLSDIDPPNGYTIQGEGKGGPAGGVRSLYLKDGPARGALGLLPGKKALIQFGTVGGVQGICVDPDLWIKTRNQRIDLSLCRRTREE